MSRPAIRGWCPGARLPMKSGDGLVVRVSPPLGALDAAQAAGLAALAERHGDGFVALTNRANLQLRGVAEAAHPALLDGLDALGLLDPEDGRPTIVLDPLRPLEGEDRQAEAARALNAALAAPDLAALPSKFGFVVDAGPQRRLAGTSGDIRIEASGDMLIVRADGRATGRAVGDADEAAETAVALARWFLASGGVGADGRGRMARRLAAGAEPTSALTGALTGALAPNPAAPPPAPGLSAVGALVAPVFGQVAAADLRRLAGAGAGPLRITPWRMILLAGLFDLSDIARAEGLILAPGDPRLAVDACIGASGCLQASVETRALALNLAPMLAPGARLHVSGCAKGCAAPGPAALTLVGREGRFDLVEAGAPWDEPRRRGIEPQDVAALITG